MMTPLDHFIRDLDERKGKIPCCQEVTDIQSSVENVLKDLLLEVEKENPFFKTTLINSGSFYEGTKAGQPDEFDYFVQLDYFSEATDILVDELPRSTVIVIPTTDVKAPFVETFNEKAMGFQAYGMRVLDKALQRHGPAYSLELEWTGGKLYRGLKISVDLSLAVKIKLALHNYGSGLGDSGWQTVTSRNYLDIGSSMIHTFKELYSFVEKDGKCSKWISSYALKTLVLFEWEQNPTDEQWAGRNLSERFSNILERLLSLRHRSGFRSFFYKDYNILPSKEDYPFRSYAVDKITTLHNCILSIRNYDEYKFEDCFQSITEDVKLTCQKMKLTSFLALCTVGGLSS
ncbi:hypothetical protein OS493_033756 [Desmophyllum pertusum]|uniref:Mab-21-like HhH/H2TH-like domain-containing protein n=1 Tax=Desmophyllum pertusum TaxID=174260 RepID=A0A9W9Z831_9CNID|nr:hypothetical protein OS493_033756 [Desmophyllum pertusum]